MRWALGALIGVIALAILGIVAGPSFVDWDSRKPLIAATLEEASGLAVSIDGNVDVTLFPRPRLTVSKISLSGEIGGVSGETDIRWARASFTLSKLLRGEINVTNVEIVEPYFRPTKGANEETQPASDPAVGSSAGSVSGSGSRSGASNSRDNDDPMRKPWLDPAVRVQILDGVIDVGSTTITGIKGDVIGPKSGARLRTNLQFILDDVPYDAEFRAALPGQADGPVSLRVRSNALDAMLSVSGRWRRGSSGDLIGDAAFTLTGARLPELVSQFAPKHMSFLAHEGALRAEGRVSFDGTQGQFSASELIVETPGLAADGAIVFEGLSDGEKRPFLGIEARFSRLDFDRFSRKAGTPESSAQSNRTASLVSETVESDEAVSFSAFGEAGLLSTLGEAGFDAQIALTAAGARFRNTLIRRVQFRAALDAGSVTIEELSASLPGGADLSVAGFGDLTAQPPILEGNASLIADDFRRFATWLGMPDPGVSADRLRRFSLVSGVTLQPDRFDVLGAAIEIDDISAEASARLSLDGSPALGLRLAVSRINFDAFRPPVLSEEGLLRPTIATPTSDESNASDPGALDPIPTPVNELEETASSFFQDFRASIDLRIGEAVALGAVFRNSAIQASIREGRVSIERAAVADLSGGTFSMRGEVALSGPEGPEILSAAAQGRATNFGTILSAFNAPDGISRQFRLLGGGRLEAVYERQVQETRILDVPSVQAPGHLSLVLTAARGALRLDARKIPDRAYSFLIEDGAFSSPEVSLEDVSATLSLDPQPDFMGAEIDRAVFTLNEGQVTGAAQFFREGDTRYFNTQFRAVDIHQGYELGDLNGALGFRARLNGAGVLTSKTRVTEPISAHVEKLDGTIAVTGAVSLFLGDPISTRVAIKNVEDTRSLLSRYFTDRDASLAGNLVLNQGVISADRLFLKGSSGSEIAIEGVYDMRRHRIDGALLLFVPNPSPGALSAVNLTVQGPAARPDLLLTAPVYE